MKKWLFGLIFLIGATVFSGCSVLSFNQKGGLQVTASDNEPAHVYLDGKLAGTTPYVDKELKPKDYTLEIRPDNTQLATYETKVSVKNNLLTYVAWKLGNRPETSGGVIYEMEKLTDNKSSELSINTIPDGSIVQVDGKAQGFSPVLVEHLSAGEHEYEVSLPSYQVQKNTINVVQGFRMNISLKLAKQENVPSATPAAEQAMGDVSEVIATGSATPKPTATPSATPKLGTTASSSAVVADPHPEIPKPKILIKPTGYTDPASGKEALHVRNSASPDSTSPGLVFVGEEYPYLKQFLDGWYKITYKGGVGWVSGQYVQLIQ